MPRSPDACGGECWVQAHYAARAHGRPAGYAAPFPYCDLVRPMLEQLAAEAALEATPSNHALASVAARPDRRFGPGGGAAGHRFDPRRLRRPICRRRGRLHPLRLHMRLLRARACPARSDLQLEGRRD